MKLEDTRKHLEKIEKEESKLRTNEEEQIREVFQGHWWGQGVIQRRKIVQIGSGNKFGN